MEYSENSNLLNRKTKKLLEYINTCQQISSNNINYRFFTDSLSDLSGASLVVLNLVSDTDKSKTSVKAISGDSEILSQLMNAIGFNLEGSDWDGNYNAINIMEKNKLVSFSSFRESGFFDSVPEMVPVFKMIEKFFVPSEIHSMDFEYQGVFLGIITLIMPTGKRLENQDLIELYMSQISGTVKRLRAERKLQQKVVDLQISEQKIRTYLQESPLGIFIVDLNGRYIGVNRAACTMSGYSENELLDMHIPDLLTPDFLNMGMNMFDKIIAEGSAEIDILLQKKDKETFWVNLSAVRIDDVQFIAFCQDITERKEREERSKELTCLHSFSQMLQTESNNLDRIISETVALLPPAFEFPEDVGACITYQGREFKTANFKQTPWKIFAHLESYGIQVGMIDVCYNSAPRHKRESFSSEEKLMLRTISEHLSRVTARIQASEELQESKNQLATTLHSIGDGVIVTDFYGRITRMNPRAEKLTGWTLSESLGYALNDVFHIVDGKTGELVPNPVYQVIETGENQGLANDTILIARDGTKVHIADSAAPIQDDEGRIFGVVMVFSDVSERRNAEESLLYQFKFEKMLASISNTFASEPSVNLEQNIRHALIQIGEFFQVDRSYVFQFSEDGKLMSNTHEWCAEGTEAHIDKLQNVPLENFPWWSDQILKKQHVHISDVNNLPSMADAEKKEFQFQNIRALLSIPMLKNGAVFGFLGLDLVKESKTWSENQIMLLTVAVDLVAHAYTRNLEEEKVRYLSYRDGLTGLYNRNFLEKELERLDTQRQLPIAIIMADLNGLKLFNDAFGHDVGDEMLRQTANILKGCCRREDIIARWGGDEFVIFLPQTAEEDVQSIFARINEKCEDTFVKDISLSLSVGYAIKTDASEDLLEILKEAEENMYVHKRDESLHINYDLIGVMLSNLAAKSSESVTHYHTMKSVAHKIGLKIGLSQSSLNRLEVLISLHDIGEITVAEEILNKSGPLTEDEWDIIKKHPETGFRISRATEGISHVAEDILSHHERWDGLGYPRGLMGEHIPLLARIATIADAYEVMSSGRSYKPAMTESEIIDELRRCAGSQFDPELIEVFLLIITNDNME